jgi:hypothetical protein
MLSNILFEIKELLEKQNIIEQGGFFFLDLLVPGCPIRDASIGRCPLSERASTLARRACERVP